MRSESFVCSCTWVFLLVLGCSLIHGAVSAQEIRVDLNVAASPPSGGWHPWYEVHADPENASNLVICGSKWNAKDNASYGFVYSSADGGKTWRQAIEDKSSTWVSEQSCAYGVRGTAYFVADTSKVIEGEPHHELGTTRIYVSHDAGRTWKLGITTGWTDYSTSVVDTAPGPNQNRLYVFFNNLQTFYTSLENKDAVEAESKNSTGTRVGMISYKDGDARVAGPFTSIAMAQERYHGSYPAPAFLLKDGSLLTFYTAKRRNEKNVREVLVEAVRSGEDRGRLDTPVNVASSTENREDDPSVKCSGMFLSSAATYDAEQNKLYLSYPEVRDKKCSLLLTTSSDGGKNWSKAEPIYSAGGTAERVYADPALVVNKDGVLGVMWQEKYRSGCWMFATSTDGGKSLSSPRELGTCSREATKPSILTSAYLWTSFFQADSTGKSDTARINLRNTRNAAWRNAHGIAVTPDGAFHPVWIDAGGGDGEIRTAAVRVVAPDVLISEATRGLKDVTSHVSILYGGDQHYDPKTSMLTLDVVFKNNSGKPLRGPFRLAVTRLYKRYGDLEIANAENKVTGAGSIWDLGPSVLNGVLAPGATSKPFPLKFHYLIAEEMQRSSDDILGLTTKLFAGAQETQASAIGAVVRVSRQEDKAGRLEKNCWILPWARCSEEPEGGHGSDIPRRGEEPASLAFDFVQRLEWQSRPPSHK